MQMLSITGFNFTYSWKTTGKRITNKLMSRNIRYQHKFCCYSFFSV